MPNPDFDIVIFGATSFVGKITVEHFLKTYGVNNNVRWAIAARSEAKLDALKTDLGEHGQTIPVLIADSGDLASLEALCATTKIVISTVGPYALYGELLVKACAESGTHYCDLTGETPWIASMLSKYEDTAKQNGAMIVNCCGFDSIPSDLGVHFLQNAASQKFGKTCQSIEMGVAGAKGGFSGGTIASLINVVREAEANPELRQKLTDPYMLCPEGHPYSAKQRTAPRYYSEALNAWCAPFVMASINTRIVHRSNALKSHQYGENFRYSEYTMTGSGLSGNFASLAMTGAMGGFMAMLSIPPTRWFSEKVFLPKPGEGPSKKEQEEGFFNLLFVGKTDDEQTLSVKVKGVGDPGYGSTSKMLTEAALTILELAESASSKGGFWTPASLMGDALISRLTENAQLTFEIVG